MSASPERNTPTVEEQIANFEKNKKGLYKAGRTNVILTQAEIDI
jgi:hypothetical protein